MTRIPAECDTSIRIGGQAGQGMRVISSLLGKIFLRRGLWVFVNHDIMSRVRGGHNYTQIRVSGRPVRCPSARIDLLICLDRNTLDLHRHKTDGLVFFDPGQTADDMPSGDNFIPIELERIAREHGDARMLNSVASGAALALYDLPLDTLNELLGATFASKGDKVVEANRRAARAGYDLVRERHAGRICTLGTPSRGEPESPSGAGSPPESAPAPGLRPGAGSGRLHLMGSEAMALGAIAANVRFYAAYPMSPSTPIMEYLIRRARPLDLVVVQAEDEIAAVNMAIGGFFTGARSMVGTSGGGLALMVEGISLAGMTETPVVIVDCQRPGPATGLPTRTEQADLLFVAHGGHGEFPRPILAPGDAAQAFALVHKAVYLAEKYQTPVFVLGDQLLNDSSWTVEPFDLSAVRDDPQSLAGEPELAGLAPYSYRRYAPTATGISPRLVPGTPGQIVYADSDEHTEDGHITESAEVRAAMVDKRLRKLAGLRDEIARPAVYPDEYAEMYLVGWGSTLGVMAETVDRLREDGINGGYIHFSEISPLPPQPLPDLILERARLVGVENNATGQLARFLRAEAGIDIGEKILKYDGRPFTPQELRERLDALGR